MAKLLFVVNPKAGRTVIKSEMIDIIETFTDAGYDVTVYPTKGKRETVEHVYNVAENYDLVVCAGGDGTLDNTVGGIMRIERRLKRRIHMGYIPCGSTNDYARSLNMSFEPVKAAQDIVKGSIFHLDAGRLENDFFIYIAAFGAFTDVSYSTPQYLKNSLGHIAYVMEAVRSMQQIKSYDMQVWFDGELIEGEFIYGQITNSLSVGGFRNIGPVSTMSFSDGKFETVFIRKPETALQLQKIVNDLLMENMDDSQIVFRKASRIVIKCPKKVSWTLDGEYGGSYKVTRVSNIHKGVSLVLRDEPSRT